MRGIWSLVFGNCRQRAFTLLELLASITLLVILGSMLFEIFHSSSEVVRISNARQEVFQYARAALEFMEREIRGAFTGCDANVSTGIKGMRIYKNANMSVEKRDDSEGIFFSTGIMARDTRETVGGSPNPYFGHDVNVARVAYYLNDERSELWKSAIYRSEMYNLTTSVPEEGTPFVRNCLYFNIKVFDQFTGVQQFQTTDWNSDEVINVGGFARRRGLPKAIYFEMRITDEHHAKTCKYRWKSSEEKWFVPGPDPNKDYWGEEDPVVRPFSQVVYFGKRSD